MKRIIGLGFCIITSFLFSNEMNPSVSSMTTLDGDPSANIENSVNVVSGDYFVTETDYIVPGVEPIPVTRTYLSSNQIDNRLQSVWKAFCHTKLRIEFSGSKSKADKIYLCQPQGNVLQYENLTGPKKSRRNFEVSFGDSLAGCSNLGGGELSARTNIRNNTIRRHRAENYFVHTAPDGTKSWYYTSLRRLPLAYLEKEKKPNGNWVFYEWTDQNFLKRIFTTNPDQTITYAELTIEYVQNKDHILGIIKTSDGKRLERYHKITRVARDIYDQYLIDIKRPNTYNDGFNYEPIYTDGPKLALSRSKNGQSFIKVDYHKPSTKKKLSQTALVDLRRKNPKIDRVKSIQFPTGPFRSWETVYQFNYKLNDLLQPPKETTFLDKVLGLEKKGPQDSYAECVDPFGTKTRYHFNNYSRPHCIEIIGTDVMYPRGHRQESIKRQMHLYHADKPTFLSHKALFVGTKLKSLEQFSYHDNGNLSKLESFGNFTGKNPRVGDFCTNQKKVKKSWIYSGTLRSHSGEKVETNFTYHDDELRLVKTVTDPNNCTTTTEYHPGTDLPTSILLSYEGQIKSRQFKSYSKDHILIKEITDDGSDSNPSSLKGVSQRLVKTYTLKKDAPAQNFPLWYEESFFDTQSKSYKTVKKIRYHYDLSCNVIQEDLFLPNGKLCYSIKRTFDDRNRLISETDPLGRVSTFSYDHLNNLTKQKKAGSALAEHFNYDLLGAKTSSFVKDRKKLYLNKTKRDLLHRVTELCDSKGKKINLVYDALGNEIERALPAQRTVSGDLVRPKLLRFNDPMGRPIREINPKGFIKKTEYTTRGQPYFISYSDGSEESFIYNLNGTVAKKTDRNGVTTKYTYNFQNQVLSEAMYSIKGKLLRKITHKRNALHLLETTSSDGTTIKYKYDGLGRTIQEVKKNNGCLISNTKYTYDNLGRKTSVLSIAGNKTKEHKISYDLVNRITKEMDLDETKKIISKKEYIYDNFDNKIAIITHLNSSRSIERFEYDKFSRVTKHISPESRITLTQYEDFYKHPKTNETYLRRTTISPKGLVTRELLSDENRIEEKEILSPLHERLSHEQFFYDLCGNKTCHIVEVYSGKKLIKTITNTWDYDRQNRVVKLVEGKGSKKQKITRYSYCYSGKLDTLIKPDGSSIKYCYDDLLRLKEVKASKGDIHYELIYDAHDRVIKELNHITKKVTSRIFNDYGDLVSETQESGLKIQYKYDLFHRITRLTLPDNSFVKYNYDSFHLRSVKRFPLNKPNYQHAIISYCISQKILEEALPFSLGSLKHDFNLDHTKTKVSSDFFSQEILAFDDEQNPTQIKRDTPNSSTLSTFQYDELNHLVIEEGLFNNSYKFDSIHNRTAKNNKKYQLNHQNELLSDGRANYTYDTNGNRISKKTKFGDLHYEYDSLDRLISMTTTSLRLEFSYDHSLRRISKKILKKESNSWKALKLEYFLYDGEAEIGSFDAKKNVKILRIPKFAGEADIGNSIAIEINNKAYIPLYDLFGNVSELIDPKSQTSVESYIYSVYGECQIKNPKQENIKDSLLSNPYRYQSKRFDSESNLTLFGKRYYDAKIGSWITPDPKGLSEGPSLYAYLYGMPLIHVDIWGLEAESVSSKHMWRSLIVGPFGYYATRVATGIAMDTRWIHDDDKTLLGTINDANNKAFNNLLNNKYSYSDHDNHSSVIHYKPLKQPAIAGHDLFFINGISNTKQGAEKSALSIRQALPSYNMTLIHNSTHTLGDIGDVVFESLGGETSIIRRARSEFLFSLAAGNHIHIFAHSEGGMITQEALKDRRFNPYRDKINVYTFGAAKFVDSSSAQNVTNYVSKLDLVPVLNYSHQGKIRPICSQCIRLLDNKTRNPYTEHTFLGPTYQNGLLEASRKLQLQTMSNS